MQKVSAIRRRQHEAEHGSQTETASIAEIAFAQPETHGVETLRGAGRRGAEYASQKRRDCAEPDSRYYDIDAVAEDIEEHHAGVLQNSETEDDFRFF